MSSRSGATSRPGTSGAVSIGYQVHRFEVSKPEAARELWRAVDWTPFEVSAVAVGADPAAGFRAQHPLHDCVLHRRDAPTPQGASPMTDKTETPASDAGTPATTQPTEPVETEETTMTEPKAAAPDPKVAASETRSHRSNARGRDRAEDRVAVADHRRGSRPPARQLDPEPELPEVGREPRCRSAGLVQGSGHRRRARYGAADPLEERVLAGDPAARGRQVPARRQGSRPANGNGDAACACASSIAARAPACW